MIAPADVLPAGATGALGWIACEALRWLRERAKTHGEERAAAIKAASPSDMLGAMAAFQDALNRQAEAQTEGLRQELRIQAAKLDRAEGRIDSLEAENAQCRHENEQLQRDIERLNRLTAAAPPAPGP
jgi:chromosome segregation ATPase